MTRTEKGTRQRGLTSRLRAGVLDALTGSYGSGFKTRTIAGFISQRNEQTFNESVSVVEFTTQSLSLPVGLPSGSSFITYELQTTMPAVSASVARGVGDKFVESNKPEQTFRLNQRLFRDHHNFATPTQTSTEFFKTGSAVNVTGPGFQTPLWSKTKIEIDLSPGSLHKIRTYTGGTGGDLSLASYYMAYWDFEQAKYTGVGSGSQTANYFLTSSTPNVTLAQTKLKQFLEDQAVGFGKGTGYFGGAFFSFDTKLYQNIGHATSEFGFPTHPKFASMPANQLCLTGVLNKPFLLEKAVLHVSFSFQMNTVHTSGYDFARCINFFLLNERQQFIQPEKTRQTLLWYWGDIITVLTPGNPPIVDITSSQPIPTTYRGNQITTTRDLVGYSRFIAIPSISLDTAGTALLAHTTKQADYVHTTPDTKTFAGEFIIPFELGHRLSTAVGTTANNGFSNLVWLNVNSNLLLSASNNIVFTTNTITNRSGHFMYNSGRSWTNEFEAGDQKPVSLSENINGLALGPFDIGIPAQSKKLNPYVLLPTDKLVFGLQLPLGEVVNDELTITTLLSASIEFPSTDMKLVLFGSHLAIGPDGNYVEQHDNIDQPLTSVAIHEIIQ